jgi:L-amino acid N-acyltransferase YncA
LTEILRSAQDDAVHARLATPADAAAIARIYNEGIEERIATFETRPRTAADVEKWFDGIHPVVVIEDNGAVIAFASTSTYRPRDCYAGIAEFSVYAARAARGRGAGRAAMGALIDEARRAGFWKLVSRVFVENTPSRALLRSIGFREVGIYQRHARLDGVWRDVVIVEKQLG